MTIGSTSHSLRVTWINRNNDKIELGGRLESIGAS